MENEIIERRKHFSQDRVKQLKEKLTTIKDTIDLPGLCIYATGSYARYEASQHSDIDLFFVHSGSSKKSQLSRIDEIRLFSRIIEIGEELNFPAFSNDGEFLKVLYLDDILEMLGGRDEDFHNYFTARMLLLLESKPLFNTVLFEEMIDSIVDAYYRDYPDHAEDFRPVFLINDIIRFWKTLCLNYEHRRNKPEDDKKKKRKQQVKNFKLKFSRLMTCFGMVIAICENGATVEKDKIVELTTKTPFERFDDATINIPEVKDTRDEILKLYSWFMEYTELTTENLLQEFESKEKKIEMFKNAEAFGEKIYQNLDYFAKKNHYERYLIV